MCVQSGCVRDCSGYERRFSNLEIRVWNLEIGFWEELVREKEARNLSGKPDGEWAALCGANFGHHENNENSESAE